MKTLLTALSLTVGLLVAAQAQSPLNGTVFGLEFKASQLKLANVDPATGQVQVISPSVISPDQFASGNSDMDPVNDRYFYIRSGQIITVDANTGLMLHNPTITCPSCSFNTVVPITNIAYNWADSTLYGLLVNGQQVYFAKVDPVTGIMTVLSNGPISPDQFSSGVSDIDPIGGRYFYIRANSLYTVSIATASVLNVAPLINPNNATAAITNIAYDWISDQIYGLNFVGGTWTNNGNIIPGQLRLATVDVNSGLVSLISSQVLSPDQFSSGVSDIDPVAGRYYYMRVGQIITVDIASGALLFKKNIPNNGAIQAITNIAVHQDITTKPDPVASFVDDHHDLTIQFKNTSAFARQADWDFGDGHVSTDRHPDHAYAFPGTYTVTLTVENAEGERSMFVKSIVVEDAAPEEPVVLGLPEEARLNGAPTTAGGGTVLSVDPIDPITFSLFPNPVRDQLTITLDGTAVTPQLTLIDLLGNVVHTARLQPGTQRLDVSAWAAGTYFYRVSDQAGSVKTGRLVINR